MLGAGCRLALRGDERQLICPPIGPGPPQAAGARRGDGASAPPNADGDADGAGRGPGLGRGPRAVVIDGLTAGEHWPGLLASPEVRVVDGLGDRPVQTLRARAWRQVQRGGTQEL